jgi:TPR repeat protein
MAMRISEGRGCESDVKAATSTFVRAAEAGDATAEFNLGVRYATGRGIAPAQAASAKAFYFGGGHQKEQQENPDKAEQQGDLWDDFSNFEEECDFSQTRIALEWYKRAAARGHSKALYNLAGMMARGEGLPLSTDGAEHLLRQAARQGYPRAQYALALHLARRAEDLRRSSAAGAVRARLTDTRSTGGRQISRQAAGASRHVAQS